MNKMPKNVFNLTSMLSKEDKAKCSLIFNEYYNDWVVSCSGRFSMCVGNMRPRFFSKYFKEKNNDKTN